MLSDPALLQYGMHESIIDAIIGTIILMMLFSFAVTAPHGGLNLPDNIVRFYIPPYMPEMNPIEQIWKKFESVDSITKYLLPWKKSSSDCAILFALCLTKSFPVSRAEIGYLKFLIKK